MNAQLCVRQSLEIKFEVNRRRIDGIATKNNEQVNSPRIEVSYQVTQRLRLVDRVCFDWISIKNGLANIAERIVHRMDQRVDFWQRGVPWNDQARTFML